MKRVIALTLLIGCAWVACVDVPSDIDINLDVCIHHDSVDVAGDSIISLCRVPGE